MVGVSLAIIVLIIVLAVMLARAGRRPIIVFTVPVVCIPSAYLLASVLRMAQYAHIFLVIGFAVGVAANVPLSRRLRTTRARRGYICGCCVFLAALLFAYLVNLSA